MNNETNPRPLKAIKKGSIKSRVLKLSLLFVSLILILYILAFHFWQTVSPSQTATLAAGELKKLYMAEAVLVRDETVITSPATGQLIMLVQDGERVRAGDSIAEVKTMGGDSESSARSALVRAPRSGVVVCRTDGLEGVLNPGQVDILEIAGMKLKANESAARDDGKNKRYEKGQPLIKVVDNLSPLVICLQVPDGFPADRVKKDVIISMVWENNEFSGRVTDVREYGGRRQAVIRSLSYPGDFLRNRKVFLALVGESVTGCLVPAKSLVEKEGREGLQIMNKQRVIWVPVKVEGVVNDRAAITGEGVIPGTRYVVNPRRFF